MLSVSLHYYVASRLPILLLATPFFSLVSPASEFAISDLPLCSTATITVRSCHS